MSISGIYKIQSKIKPERFYIGSAADIPNRWSVHLSLLRRNYHFSNKLQHHYNKYGKDDLVFSIIMFSNNNDLLEDEDYFIKSLNPWFNTDKNAGNRSGWVMSEETKRKISESKKGKPSPLKGIKHTPEQIAKFIAANKGRKMPKEYGERISERMMGHIGYNKGKKMPEGFGEKVSKALKGKKPWNTGKTNVYSEETINIISEKIRAFKTTEKGQECTREFIERNKKNKYCLGRKDKPETILKKSESAKRGWMKRRLNKIENNG